MACLGTVYNLYNGNGIITDYMLTVDANEDISDIIITIDSVEQTEVTDYIIDAGFVKFTVAPAQGTIIRFQRVTQEPRLVDYTNVSVVNAETMDIDGDQSFQLAQEAKCGLEDTLRKSDAHGGNFNAEGLEIKNVAAPTTGDSAANKDYVDLQNISTAGQFYREVIIATVALQTEFVLGIPYFPGTNTLWVYDNDGNYLDVDVDYTETSGATVTLTNGIAIGEKISFVWMRPTALDIGIQYISDIFANRPAAGTDQILFYATDTLKLYYDNGTFWEDVVLDVPPAVREQIDTSFAECCYDGAVTDPIVSNEFFADRNYNIKQITVYAKTAGTSQTDLKLKTDNGATLYDFTLNTGVDADIFFPTNVDINLGQKLLSEIVVVGANLEDLVIRVYLKRI